MPVTEYVKIVMRLLLQIFTIREQKLIFLSGKFFFTLNVADAASARPEMCNAHAYVGVNPTEKPLTKFTIKKPFQNFIIRIAWPKPIAMAD